VENPSHGYYGVRRSSDEWEWIIHISILEDGYIRKQKLKVVVIGNGIGGFSTASTIRHLDNQCDISMISAETHPLYSACVLPDYISGEISRERVFVKSDKDYMDLGIHTLFGREVKEIDTTAPKVVMDNGESLSFDKLILATGSEAIVFGDTKRGIFKLKTLKDADEILIHNGKKAVVIGAGAIGIEIGIALYHKGYKVTIVEMLDQVLPLGLDQKGADKVKGILEEHGIEVFNGERSEKVLGRDRVKGLLTNKRELECDTLIWAVGMRPKVGLAKQTGIEIGDKGGIRVNSHMETNVPDIYACGDCVESNDILTGEPYLNLFWHNANRQGSVVARNCVGLPTDYLGSQNILNIDVFENHVAGFGFTEAALYRFKDISAFGGKLPDISIIEKGKNGSYYRLVIVGDRCMGGQFINISPINQGIGLLWSIMVRRRSIKELLKIFESEDLICHRPWFRRVKPFFI
jgi:NADH oxidase (H2O2-forming)